MNEETKFIIIVTHVMYFSESALEIVTYFLTLDKISTNLISIHNHLMYDFLCVEGEGLLNAQQKIKNEY